MYNLTTDIDYYNENVQCQLLYVTYVPEIPKFMLFFAIKLSLLPNSSDVMKRGQIYSLQSFKTFNVCDLQNDDEKSIRYFIPFFLILSPLKSRIMESAYLNTVNQTDNRSV